MERKNSIKRKAPPPPVKHKPNMKPKPAVPDKPNSIKVPELKMKKPFMSELSNVISKQNKLHKNFDYQDEVPPTSEKTCSLTEVSSLKQTKSKTKSDLNDTLDFTLSDEGFDVSPCEEAFDSSPTHAAFQNFTSTSDVLCDDEISEVQFSDDDENIDDFLNSLNFVPPPPPPDLEIDDEEEVQSDGFDFDDVLIPSDENFDSMIIPPPPPPEIDADEFISSDEESIISQPSAFNENDKYDNMNDKLNLLTSNTHNNKSKILDKSSDAELKSSFDNDDSLDFIEKKVPELMSNKIVKASPLKYGVKQQHVLPMQCLNELKGKIETENDPAQKPFPSTKDNNKLYSNNNFENSGVTTVKPQINKPIEFDSGHSTAQSQEVSDYDDYLRKTKNENLNENGSSLLRNNSSSSSLRKRRSSVSSKVSRTWSSASCSSNNDDNDQNSQSRINLREMFLKNIKTLDSDEEEGEHDNNESIPYDDNIEDSDFEDNVRLNEVDVEEWTNTDVCDWLELIGLPHLQQPFKASDVDGQALANLDMGLLDSMNIDCEEDRELILSEVYALQNPSDDGELEISMLDALDNASGEEREKMLALINALHEPSNSSYINNYLQNNPSSRNKQQPQIKTPDIVVEQVKCVSSSQLSSAPSRMEFQGRSNAKNSSSFEDENDKMMKLLAAKVYDPDEDETMDTIDSTTATPSPDMEKRKKKKGKGFFASLRRKGHKKSKSAILDTSPNTLLQTNPRGMLSILWTQPNTSTTTDIRLLVAINDSAFKVCAMCLDYLKMYEDINCFYIAISRTDRKVENVDLTDQECPLMFQCKWTDMETYQFELKQRPAKHIILNYEDHSSEEKITLKMNVSPKTTVKELLPVVLKRLDETKPVKYFTLKQPDKDELDEDVLLLDLPLNGYKFHVFQLINSSPQNNKLKRGLSFTEVKKMETEIEMLKKQVGKLNEQIDVYKRAEDNWNFEKQQLHSESLINKTELEKKEMEIKKVQYELKNQSFNQKLRVTTPTNVEREMKLENISIQSENKHLKLQVEQMQGEMKTYQDKTNQSKEELDVLRNKQRKLEHENEDLKEKYSNLERSRKPLPTTDNTEQMKKLYIENKDCLLKLRSLENKLCESEDKLLQRQHDHEVDNAEVLELRVKLESWEHSILEKDSKILEYEYKLQKKERDIREKEDQIEDEQRKRKKDVGSKETAERQVQDLNMKLDNIKKQLTERDKQLQTMKSQLNKQDKKLTKQKTLQENELNTRKDEINFIQSQHENELKCLEDKMENLQKLLVDKDINKKQTEFDFNKRNEEFKTSLKDMERKLTAKDVIIDRLENKIAKSDLNVSSQLQSQEDVLYYKEDTIQQLEMKVVKLESEHASKLRELSNTVRTKESIVSKLETRIKKMETSNRETSRKYDKMIVEKDRLLQQINNDRDKESKDLKSRVRQMEDDTNSKERLQSESQKKLIETKVSLENRLKKKDKEYKQQKYLLEKLLEIVNSKSPSLLRLLEKSLDEDRVVSPRHVKSPSSFGNRVTDEWC